MTTASIMGVVETGNGSVGGFPKSQIPASTFPKHDPFAEWDVDGAPMDQEAIEMEGGPTQLGPSIMATQSPAVVEHVETPRQRLNRLRGQVKAKRVLPPPPVPKPPAPTIPLKVYIPVIGNRDIHSSHDVRYLHGIFACWTCGSWATSVPRGLNVACKPPTDAGHDVIVRVKKGWTPKSSVQWPEGQT